MPRAGTLFDENEPLVTAAVIAAGAVAQSSGFRQRDVRFFIELFSNWLESTTGARALNLHNTQVQRHLDMLTRVKWTERIGRTPPRWQLTPEGLVELLGRLVHRRNLVRLDEFFLVFHFLDAYGARLRRLATQGGRMGSQLLAVDLNELLDTHRFIERERARVARELSRLAVRVQESRSTSELARERIASGAALSDVIALVQARYPYELNSQKPLQELLAALPTAWRREELIDIAERRAGRFWEPLSKLLLEYDRILESLSKDASAQHNLLDEPG
jgi:hypothetical protein